MKVASLSLPHPVLGISNDVSGEYTVTDPEVRLSSEEIHLRFTHKLSNTTLNSMISSGKATFCVELNCVKTFYRETFSTSKAAQEITIKSHLLRDRVDCAFYITASDDIRDYKNSEANSDYSGFEFYISKGDVLAFGGVTFFVAEKEWQAYRSVASFMEIRKDENRNKGPMEIDLGQEKIVIKLSKQDYERYNSVRGGEHLASIFHCAIVLPALIYAISQLILDKSGAYAGLKWYEVLLFRKNSDTRMKGVDWTDSINAPKIAQLILDDPLTRTLNDIEAIIATSEE
jgi:hypothetical protein